MIRQQAGILTGVLMILITASPPVMAQEQNSPEMPNTNLPIRFDIAAQPLNTALRDFALATDIQISFQDDLTKGVMSPGIQGMYTPKEALQGLLPETGLNYRFTSSNTVTIENIAHSNTSRPIRLKTVTVTARKRKEDIREVPFSVSAIGQEELQRTRVTTNRSLQRRIANLNYVPFARGFNRLNIRGVGDPAGGFAADDTSVGYFVDGVPIPLLGIDGDLLDIQQVEVLRGPQNLLFGRNAQGGAISITTTDPSEKPEFSLGSEFGNLFQRKVTGIASGPITDEIGGRLAVQYRGREGDVRNDLGEDLRDIDAINIVGKLTADLGKNTDASTFVRFERQEEDLLFGVLLQDPEFPRARQDSDPDQITETLATGLTVDHHVGNLTFSSLTGFYYGRSDFFNDQTDGRISSAQTGLPLGTFNNPSTDFATQETTEYRINQEFRLTGDIQGVEVLLGGNIFYSDWAGDFKNTIPSFGLFGDFISDITTQSYDVFGSVTVPIGDRLRLNGGLRYTYEIEDFDGGFKANSPMSMIARNLQKRSATFDFVTGRLSASYDVFDDVTAYVTVARGAKAGGFSNFDTDLSRIQGAQVDQFSTATTMNYEIGSRGTLWNNRIRFNVAAFFSETKDEQLSVFNQQTFISRLENMDTESYGAEFELTAEPIEVLTIQGSLGLLHTKIKDAPATSGARVGGDIPQAPEVSFSLSADYWYSMDRFNVPGDLVFGGDYQYVGARDLNVANTLSLDSYDIVNLRVTFVTEAYEIMAFAQNLLDETYAVGGNFVGLNPQGNPIATVIAGQPRMYGFGAKVRF